MTSTYELGENQIQPVTPVNGRLFSLCLCFSVCPSVSLSLFLSVRLSLCFTVSLFLLLSVCVSFSFSLSLQAHSCPRTLTCATPSAWKAPGFCRYSFFSAQVAHPQVPLPHLRSSAIISLLFFTHTKHVPASGPLPWLFLLLGTPFVHVASSFIFFRSQLKHHCIS